MNTNIPDSFFDRNKGAVKKQGVRGFGDFDEPHIDAVRPVPNMPRPPGPANFPLSENAPVSSNDLLKQILAELVKQNTASRPVIRSKSLGVSDNGTLDWTTVGIMDRLVMRNAGPDNVWFAFDTNGPAVNGFTSDQSFLILPNESINLVNCQFRKIGLITGPGTTGATVNAIAFQAQAGNQSNSII